MTLASHDKVIPYSTESITEANLIFKMAKKNSYVKVYEDPTNPRKIFAYLS